MKSILSIVDSEGCERGVYTIADYLLHVFWSHMLNNLINLVVMTLLDQRVLKIKNQLQKSLPHHVLYSLFHIGGVGEGFRVWVYYPEVWGDNASRKAKSCLYYVCNWLCSFSLAMYAFKNNFENIIYATFCACTSLHVFSFIQKLKVILEEINQTWDEHITAWKSRPW
ncbi:unnamed protein product [Debaryomyces tyrocola]|nr:unnamed protein product [Debaryomyces tyrocola]